jgi:hypothetical protein
MKITLENVKFELNVKLEFREEASWIKLTILSTVDI